MSVDKLYIAKVTEGVESIVSQLEGYFLVEVKVLQGNQIQVYVDADQGAAVEVLARMNKTLRKQIEMEDFFAGGDFSLEVSSPGLDRPLKNRRQYKKNIGREVDVVLKDGRKKKGILKEATADALVLDYRPKKKKGKGKKKESMERAPECFAMDKIKSIKVCIGF